MPSSRSSTQPPAIPLHLRDVHRAFGDEAAFSKILDAEQEEQKALAEVRDMQSRYLCERFTELTEGEEGVCTPVSEKASRVCTLQATILSAENEPIHEIIETVQFPHDVSQSEAAFLQLRFLLNHTPFWEVEGKDAESMREQLLPVLRRRGAFLREWCSLPDDTMPVPKLYREWGPLRISILPLEIAPEGRPGGEEEHHLARAGTMSTYAMSMRNLKTGRMIVRHSSSGLALRIDTLPAAAEGKFPCDLTGALAGRIGSRREPNRAPSVLALCTTGIQHDSLHNIEGTGKSMRLLTAPAVMHPKFGVHDTEVADICLPEILRAARNIGEVHFMTQIGKAILKTRPEKDSETAKLVVEQRGAHLKDEKKLCAYWESIRKALDAEETKCLDNGVKLLHQRSPISYIPQAGKICSDTSRKGGSLHHVELSLRIKGALSVPARLLKRGPNSLNVRIDNMWTLESHACCFA